MDFISGVLFLKIVKILKKKLEINFLYVIIFNISVWRVRSIGRAAVLKTAGLTPMWVRVPHSPIFLLHGALAHLDRALVS